MIIAVVYTAYFHLEGLTHFCLSGRYGYRDPALSIPPFALQRGVGWLGLCGAVMGCGVYTYALLCAVAFRRVLAVLLPLLFVLTAIATYFVNSTGVPITADLMEAVFETNTEEASGLISLRSVMTVGFALAVSVTLLRLLWSELGAPPPTSGSPWARGHWLRAAAGAAFTGYALVTPVTQPLAPYPHNIIRSVATYLSNKFELDQRMARRRDISDVGVDWNGAAPDDLVVVLVLGESARPDHFAINGYGRPTTPRLATIANLVSFTHVTACGTMTRTAVPCLMTRATATTMSVSMEETSLISVFNRLRFTSAWLSVNGVYGDHDSPISAIAKEAPLREFRVSIQHAGGMVLDGDLLPPLDRFLASHTGRLFAVLHTEGSHWPYTARYPLEFRRFTPTFNPNAINPWNYEAIVNSYDNSILYTDDVLARVIERLRDRNALLLYVSDHGEMVGEEGRYMHGQDRPEVWHVPMLWWASDRFLHDHAAPFARLSQRRDDAVSHDHVFHSLLDCAGARSPIIDPTLSLCREATSRNSLQEAREHHGVLPSN